MKKRLPLVLLLVALVAVAVWNSRRPHHIPGTIEGSGTIEATQVDLAPKVAGRVTHITVVEGTAVKAGDPVAQLDGVELQEQLDEALATWQEDEAKVRESRANLQLEQEQFAATLDQARARAQANVPRVPQASESTRLQEGTVQAQIELVSAQVSSARASLAAASGNALASLETYRGAGANLRTAQANLDKARQDKDRYERLYKEDAVSAQQLDTARATWRAALGQRDAAQDQVRAARAQRDAAVEQEQAAQSSLSQSRAALQQAQVNRRTVSIRRFDVTQSQAQLQQAQAGVKVAEAGRARVDERGHELQAAEAVASEAHAALALARTELANATLKAPFDGIVLSKNVEVGDLVQVGSPVVTIADLKRPYLRVFVSETDVVHIQLGQVAEVELDGEPGHMYKGVVDEIRNKAEYTPTNVQTKDERAKLVFGVRIRLDNPDLTLKPGVPADAFIHAP